jgi:protease-4
MPPVSESQPLAPAFAPPPPPPRPVWKRVLRGLVATILIVSIIMNYVLWTFTSNLFSSNSAPTERYHSGKRLAQDKLVIIPVSGTIMPPFTGRILRSIKHALEDKHVKGVLLEIDSPGGFVADSHQIYHRLKELAQRKPIIVSMKSLAASGGYYVAMGAGENSRIYAEPTTWTGSIGVIIPRYEFIGLKEKIGIDSQPLKTGEFKDALNPFKPLTEREKAVWDNILQQSFDRFLTVIDENRKPLTKEKVRKLATGQIYTADDALANGLIDAIGFEEDALKDLKILAKSTDPQVVKYEFQSGMLDLILGSQMRADPAMQWRDWLETTVPRAMFYCSWAPAIPHVEN